MSNVPDIKETGVRGFLMWLKAVQPNIYKTIAPQLPVKIPQAFSDYHAGDWKLNSVCRGKPFRSRTSQAMGDYFSMPELTVSGNYSNNDPIIPSPDFIGVPPVDAGSFTPVAIDTSQAANTGWSGADITSGLSSLIGSAAGVFMTVSQQNNLNKAVQTNLTRAQSGLSPLPLSMYGIPTAPGSYGSGGSFSGSVASSPVMIIAILGGIFLLTRRKKA